MPYRACKGATRPASFWTWRVYSIVDAISSCMPADCQMLWIVCMVLIHSTTPLHFTGLTMHFLVDAVADTCTSCHHQHGQPTAHRLTGKAYEQQTQVAVHTRLDNILEIRVRLSQQYSASSLPEQYLPDPALIQSVLCNHEEPWQNNAHHTVQAQISQTQQPGAAM